jgi:hypothetical protein
MYVYIDVRHIYPRLIYTYTHTHTHTYIQHRPLSHASFASAEGANTSNTQHDYRAHTDSRRAEQTDSSDDDKVEDEEFESPILISQEVCILVCVHVYNACICIRKYNA